MSLKEQLLQCLSIEDKTKRHLYIAGIITQAMEPLGITPIVVGGAAVGFYTVGQYSTMDIDFVGIVNDEMKEILSGLGCSGSPTLAGSKFDGMGSYNDGFPL